MNPQPVEEIYRAKSQTKESLLVELGAWYVPHGSAVSPT